MHYMIIEKMSDQIRDLSKQVELDSKYIANLQSVVTGLMTFVVRNASTESLKQHFNIFKNDETGLVFTEFVEAALSQRSEKATNE